jgi:cytochrome c553
MIKLPKFMMMTVVSLILLSACGSPVSPIPTSAVAPQPIPVTEGAATASVAATGVDECVVCHTDKQTLIETANPEEDLEGESKGVG